jgi:hypothetical protein
MNPLIEPLSLSQERFKKSLFKKYRTPISIESETPNAPSEPENIEGESLVTPELDTGDNIEERSMEKYFGEDVVVSPLAYYTINESLSHALGDYKNQIAKTIPEIMKKRSKYGQKLALIKDREDVLGEYPEKSQTETLVSENVPLTFKRHYFTRPINNVMCRICIDEEVTGIGQNRRRTYMLIDIAIIFYRKNNIGLGKEIVIRSKVMRQRKRASRKIA